MCSRKLQYWRIAAFSSVLLSICCSSKSPSAHPPNHSGREIIAHTDGGEANSEANHLSSKQQKSSPADCLDFSRGKGVGRIADRRLNEISGVVQSRRGQKVLWVHNDSGDLPRLYALDVEGQLRGIFTLEGAEAIDWEDIALVSVQDQDTLYIGDIGDNRQKRESITVYRLGEPSVPADAPLLEENISDFERFSMVYPGGNAYDSETLIVDPLSEDIYIVTKEDSGNSLVFRAQQPLHPDQLNVLAQVGQVQIGGLVPRATGGDVSPSGEIVILRTYTDVFAFIRPSGSPLADAFDQDPVALPRVLERQGEAIGFASDGQGYFTISEGDQQEIFFFERSECL